MVAQWQESFTARLVESRSEQLLVLGTQEAHHTQSLAGSSPQEARPWY